MFTVTENNKITLYTSVTLTYVIEKVFVSNIMTVNNNNVPVTSVSHVFTKIYTRMNKYWKRTVIKRNV